MPDEKGYEMTLKELQAIVTLWAKLDRLRTLATQKAFAALRDKDTVFKDWIESPIQTAIYAISSYNGPDVDIKDYACPIGTTWDDKSKSCV
jgi:hypothetical protein